MTGFCLANESYWFRWTGRIALVALLLQPVMAAAQGADPEYRLVPGDEIAVTVTGRPDLDRSYILGDTGRVTVDQVGDVVLSGLTVDEAAEVLRQRLRLFYPMYALRWCLILLNETLAGARLLTLAGPRRG